jgi:hypothetical protein
MTRPLLVSNDPFSLDDLQRLAALAGVEVDVAPDPGQARRCWDTAPLVVVGEDQVDPLVRARVPRRDRVLVLGRDLDDAGIWQRAVALGAEKVLYLPDAEPWLVDAFADAVEGGRDGLLVAVLGGRGGAGATTTAGFGATITLRPFTFFSTGGAAGGPTRLASLIPVVLLGSTSSGLRRVSMILPCADASAIFSASSGVTMSVTTVVGIGWPSLRALS